MTRPQVIAVALVASLALHLALVLVPGRRMRLPVNRETLVEVQVVPPDEAPRPAPEPPPPPPEPATAPPTPPATAAPPAPLAANAAVVLEQALAPLVPATAPAAVAPPPLQLPRRALELPGATTIAWTPPAPQALEPPPQGSGYRPATALPAGPDQQQAQLLAEALLQELAATPEEPVQPLVPPPPQLKIEGPVGKERKVVTQPPPPSVTIRHSADVRLKFWVSPRGEVVRAVPIARGDAELDRAALAYIKQFRFNPLPHGDPREQWGTIRVRFRLE